MKNELRMELYRAVKNRWLIISLCGGIGIALAQFLFSTIPISGYIYEGTYPLSVFAKWIGGENASVFPVLYYFLIPILISIPFAGSFKEDIQSRYIENIVTRVKKEKYYFAKYVAVFLTSGCIAIIPLILNFAVTALVFPVIMPQSNTALFPLFSYSLLGDLFYSHPFVYLAFYLGLNFVFFGLLATIALITSYICDNLFTTMLSPFILYLFVYAVTQITGWIQLCPFGFLRPSQPVAADPVIVLTECVLMLLSGGVYFYVGKKKEIL